MHIQQGLSHKISELPPPARNIITFFKGQNPDSTGAMLE